MRHELRLNCTRCGSFTEYHTKPGDPASVVRCDECGKKHSDDSVYMVDPDERHERDEAGTLIDPPY